MSNFERYLFSDKKKFIQNSKELIDIMLKSGKYDINHTFGDDKYTLLHKAVKENNVEIVKFLLNKGAEVDSTDDLGCTPLFYVNNLEIAKLLVEHKADFNVESDDSTLPLDYIASEPGNYEVIKYLASKGLNVNSESEDDSRDYQNFIFNAIQSDIENVRALIECGIKLNVFDREANSPLVEALLRKEYDIAKLLLKSGVNIDVCIDDPSKKDSYCLYTATTCARNNDIEALKFLIENGGNLSILDDDNDVTVLHVAAENNNVEMCNFLLENKVDINITNSKGETALHNAASKGKLDIVKLLILRSADVNAFTKENKRTPLHYAVISGNLTIVKYLVENGSYIDGIGESKYKNLKYNVNSPISLSREMEFDEITNFLSEKGNNSSV